MVGPLKKPCICMYISSALLGREQSESTTVQKQTHLNTSDFLAINSCSWPTVKVQQRQNTQLGMGQNQTTRKTVHIFDPQPSELRRTSGCGWPRCAARRAPRVAPRVAAALRRTGPSAVRPTRREIYGCVRLRWLMFGCVFLGCAKLFLFLWGFNGRPKGKPVFLGGLPQKDAPYISKMNYIYIYTKYDTQRNRRGISFPLAGHPGRRPR